MPTAVFPIIPSWPLQHELEMDTHVADFGDGFEQRVNFNSSYARANGEGATATAYPGRNKFTIKLTAMDFAGAAKDLWAFYKARKGNLEAFYLYNVPDERASIDLTGADAAGRYLVRFQENVLRREKFTLLLYSAGITMIEVRS
jgi:hypothetical protein